MMGQIKEQGQLFYQFWMEDHVPAGHLLRQVDGFLDFSSLRVELAPLYSHTGRPSVDPELMIRMLLIGYLFGIRSETRLCEEVHLNLAYRRPTKPLLLYGAPVEMRLGFVELFLL